MSATRKSDYLAHVDGLRAVAVIAVLWYHAFPATLRGGFNGVDVFFVISGFLISRILLEDFSHANTGGLAVVGRFYVRRVRRIFPSLIVVLVACFSVGYVVLMPAEFTALAQKIAASAGFMVNLLLSTHQGYFAPDASTDPLLHLWSLGIEEQFYLIWPFSLWLALRCRIPLLPLALFLGAVSFFWNADKYTSETAAAFFLPQNRFWELAIGGVAAAVYPGMASIRERQSDLKATLLSEALALGGVCMIGASFWSIDSKLDVPNARTLLPTVGTTLVLLASGRSFVNRRLLSTRALVWVGLISYPLYLWHWPLLAFARADSDSAPTPLALLTLLALSVLLAWLTVAVVERPLRFGGRVRAKAFLLVCAMALVGVCGLITYRSGGFASRFPLFIRGLATVQAGTGANYRRGTYFLNDGEGPSHFHFAPNELDPAKPTMLLWGDSHAAALYGGLQHVFGRRYNIAQRTAAGVAPLYRTPLANAGNAVGVNDFIMDSIRQTRPQIVLMHAYWSHYPEWTALEGTLGALKAMGVPKLIVVGPVPLWNVSLPQVIGNYYRHHRSEPLPYRLKEGLLPEAPRIDALLRNLCRRLGVDYVSPLEILENDDGALIRTGESAETVTSADYGHVTEAGADYLASHFPGSMFGL